MSDTKQKKSSQEQDKNNSTQTVNPAMLVKAPKLNVKVEFSEKGKKDKQNKDEN
ncbi:hypothetical protein L0P57_12775 [Anaeromassilibacillus senegalensis]|uniref:YfhD family protein n=1 Tax=Anaeromassilibacillus senegalensis TaxID=1673717 RepID=A0ABS9MLT8_9FIRM|nr:hypothetical protein [Anaeromassilibacillus senegalensis]MCG4611802.1 hypothetical protein [Anaeromassilibacillus senegalensis]